MTTQTPAYLKKRTSQAVATEVVAGLGTAQPPHVSILGGRFTLVDSAGNKKPVETTYLDCIIIDGKKGRSRVFWGVGAVFEGDQSGPPLCFSDNDVGPSSAAQQPQSKTCAACVMARWDSDVSKMTGRPVPACKTTKKIALMLPGFTFPFLLRVPVMSHNSLQTYSAQFSTGEFDVSDVVTRVSFAEDKTGELQFDFAYQGETDALPFIPQQVMELRDTMLAEKKTDLLIGRNDIPYTGEIAAPTTGQKQIAATKPQAPAAGFGGQPAAGFGETTKRKPGRPAKPATNGGAFAVAETPSQRNVQTTPAGQPKPSFGVETAPEPGDELGQALDEAFKLPT